MTNTQKPRVTIEVTERELRYLMDMIGYPNSRHIPLQSKLGDAAQQMREAKRAYNRALKQARNEKRLLGSVQHHPTEEPYDGYMFGDD